MEKPIDVSASHSSDADHLAEGESRSRQDALIPIGQLARETGISLRALRFYQSKGLLKPLRNGKDRCFTPEDRETLELILQGKRLGFTLNEIRAMVEKQPRAQGGLAISRAKCVQQIKHLECQRSEVETALAELRRIYTGMYVGGDTARKAFA